MSHQSLWLFWSIFTAHGWIMWNSQLEQIWHQLFQEGIKNCFPCDHCMGITYKTKHLHVRHLNKSLRLVLSRRILPQVKAYCKYSWIEVKDLFYVLFQRLSEGWSEDVSDVWPEPNYKSTGAGEVPKAILQGLCCPIEWSLEGNWLEVHKFCMSHISTSGAERRSMETTVWKNQDWIENGVASGARLLLNALADAMLYDFVLFRV